MYRATKVYSGPRNRNNVSACVQLLLVGIAVYCAACLYLCQMLQQRPKPGTSALCATGYLGAPCRELEHTCTGKQPFRECVLCSLDRDMPPGLCYNLVLHARDLEQATSHLGRNIPPLDTLRLGPEAVYCPAPRPPPSLCAYSICCLGSLCLG